MDECIGLEVFVRFGLCRLTDPQSFCMSVSVPMHVCVQLWLCDCIDA